MRRKQKGEKYALAMIYKFSVVVCGAGATMGIKALI